MCLITGLDKRLCRTGETMIMYAKMIKLCEESDEVQRLIELMKEHVDELAFDAIDTTIVRSLSDQLAQASPMFMCLVHEADPRRGMTEFQASYAVNKVLKSMPRRSISDDIKIINELLIEIAEQQHEDDVRSLLDRIQREISDVL